MNKDTTSIWYLFFAISTAMLMSLTLIIVFVWGYLYISQQPLGAEVSRVIHLVYGAEVICIIYVIWFRFRDKLIRKES